MQEASQLSTLLLIDKKFNNLQRVRYWKEDKKMISQEVLQMSSTLWIISCDPSRRACAHVLRTLHAMLCYASTFSGHRSGYHTSSIAWLTSRVRTYKFRLGNWMQFSYSNKSVMIEVCPLYLLVKSCEPQILKLTLLKSQDWNRGRGESAGTFARRYTANEWKKDYDSFLGFLELFSQSPCTSSGL